MPRFFLGAAQWNSVQSVCDSYSALQYLFVHTGKRCLRPLHPGEERQHPRGAVVKYLWIKLSLHERFCRNGCIRGMKTHCFKSFPFLSPRGHFLQVLLRPLKALCSFQLEHGAQIHHSKEHLLKNGMYDKPMPTNKSKIKRMEKLVTDHKICPR